MLPIIFSPTVVKLDSAFLKGRSSFTNKSSNEPITFTAPFTWPIKSASAVTLTFE
ncbi:MAG: hypothetical protein WCO37_03575 [Bacteroidota bacterium]|jgi:ABC-type molybdate transport system permease subunit